MPRNNLEATMRHIRAGVKRDADLNRRVKKLERLVAKLIQRAKRR